MHIRILLMIKVYLNKKLKRADSYHKRMYVPEVFEEN